MMAQFDQDLRRFALRIPTFLAAGLLACALALGSAGAAYAEESVDPSASSDNRVNPQQLPDSSFIYDTLISELDKADSYLNGQTVQVTGEAIGDKIRAEDGSDHCWVTVMAIDGSYAEVSVYMTTSAASVIDTFGAYGKTGTILQVRGTYHIACEEHEGLSDLHANSVTAVSAGKQNPDVFSSDKFAPGLVLICIGLVLVLAFSRLQESRR